MFYSKPIVPTESVHFEGVPFGVWIHQISRTPNPRKKLSSRNLFIHPIRRTKIRRIDRYDYFFPTSSRNGGLSENWFCSRCRRGQRLEWRPWLSLVNLTVPFTPADLWADKSALTVAALSMWISSRRPTFLCRPTNGSTDWPGKVFDPFWLRRMETQKLCQKPARQQKTKIDDNDLTDRVKWRSELGVAWASTIMTIRYLIRTIIRNMIQIIPS